MKKEQMKTDHIKGKMSYLSSSAKGLGLGLVLFVPCLFLSASCALLKRQPPPAYTSPVVAPSASSSPSSSASLSPSLSPSVSHLAISGLEKELIALERSQKSGPFTERLKAVEDFISKNRDQRLALRAYLLEAKILSEGRLLKKACQSYHQAAKQYFALLKSYREAPEKSLLKGKTLRAALKEALSESARCYFKAGDFSKGEGIIDRFIKEGEDAASKLKLSFLQMKWEFLKKIPGRNSSKLHSLSQMLAFSSSLAERQQVERQALALIQKMSLQDQLAMAKKADKLFPPFKALLFYRAGEAFFAEKKFSKAKHLFKKALSLNLPAHLKLVLRQRLKWIKHSLRLNPYLIGVIVPLSGKRKALGEKILRGLYMGLDIGKDRPWQLAIVDSKSRPDLARSQLESLFYKHHIIAVIGGLGGETAQAVAEGAEKLSLPALVFSQKMGLSQNRDFVFQNALTADQLLTPLAVQAIKDQKIKKAALLFPDDPYGREYAELFAEIFTRAGGSIVGRESYPSGEEDFKKQLKSLLHLHIKGREEEFQALKEEFLSKNSSLSRQSKRLLPENLLPKKQEFSALFIPDSIHRLKKIKNYLKYFGLKDLVLLGTDLWQRDDDKLFRNKKRNRKRNRKKGEEENFLLFSGLPKSDSFKDKAFYKEFVRLYSRPPGLFEQRAYDSALFLKQALRQKARTRQMFQKELSQIRSLKGAFYEIPISAQGLFQYPVKIYQHPASSSP